MVPRPFIYIGVILVVLALIPPALIAWARATTSEKPRIHFIQDMDAQHKLLPQQASPQVGERPLFFDRRAMRPEVEGTIARGELLADDHYYRGLNGAAWATTFPAQMTVDMALLERGQERFNIYCSPCHGASGNGQGMIHQRAMELLSTPVLAKGTTWVAPTSLHDPTVREQPIGQIFNTITNGVRTMPPYGSQVPVDDRWAIVAYVQALQRSLNARPGDVPDADRLPRRRVPAPGSEES